MDGVLAGLTVLECGPRLAAAACGRLLADLGADVIKAEPPEGDPARRAGPFPNDHPDAEHSGLYAYLNRGKRSVAVDLTTATGRRVLRRLAATVDAVVAAASVRDLERFGLRYADLGVSCPELVCTAITPFGLTGPYREYEGSEIIVTALSGVGYYVPGAVDDLQRESPVVAGAQIAGFSAGAQAGTATMVALLARDGGGGGRQVDVSEQEVLFDSLRMHLSTYAYEGRDTSRNRAQRPMAAGPAAWRCADGYVWGIPGAGAGEYAWMNLVDAMGNPEWAFEPEMLDGTYRLAHWEEIRPRVEAWARNLPKAVVADLIQQRHIPCMAVNDVGELLHEEQLVARHVFIPLGQPGMDGALIPAAPIRFDGLPPAGTEPAPSLGEHSLSVLAAAGFDAEERAWLFREGVVR